jgi:hypothetical protein
MARSVLYARYGEASVYDGKQGGWQGTSYTNPAYVSDPTDLCEFIGVSPAITIGPWTINAIVKVLPTGLNQKARRFFTDATVATLNTAGA